MLEKNNNNTNNNLKKTPLNYFTEINHAITTNKVKNWPNTLIHVDKNKLTIYYNIIKISKLHPSNIVDEFTYLLEECEISQTICILVVQSLPYHYCLLPFSIQILIVCETEYVQKSPIEKCYKPFVPTIYMKV